MDHAADEVIGGFGEAQLVLCVFEQAAVVLGRPQRDVHVAARAGEVGKRLRHEGRAQAVLLGDRLHHELEEGMLVSGAQRRVELPVHLELAVRVFVVVLIGLPAERDHRVADFRHHVVTAHERLLVVAGLGLAVGGVRDRLPVRRDQKIFALDAGLELVSKRGALRDHALEYLARILLDRLSRHHQIAGDPGDFRLPR